MALTKNVGSTHGVKWGKIQTFAVGTAHIFRGAIVVVRLTNGYAYPAVNDPDDSEKQLVVGFAEEEIDNSAGVAGALHIRVRQDGKIRLNKLAADQADVGKLALILDDEAVQLYSGAEGHIVVGRITEIADSKVFVDLEDRPTRIAFKE